MTSALVPSVGRVAITAGVRCPLRVGPPAINPRMNADKPGMLNPKCSISTIR